MSKRLDTARKTILNHRLKRYIDLNTDYGQGQDMQWFESDDNNLLVYVSSVNIPCCVHEGPPVEVLRYIETAKSYHCAVGAHIAYPDPVNRGYVKPENLDPAELRAWLLVQLGTFGAFMHAQGLKVEHVRPHGALYGAFLNDPDTARLVGEVLYQFDPWAILVAPYGPILDSVQQAVGMQVAPEIYLGKRYDAQGQLIASRFEESLPSQAVLDQARQLITDSSLTTQDGRNVKVRFKTLHVSPRLDGAVGIAERLNLVLGQPVSLPLAAVGASGWL